MSVLLRSIKASLFYIREWEQNGTNVWGSSFLIQRFVQKSSFWAHGAFVQSSIIEDEHVLRRRTLQFIQDPKDVRAAPPLLLLDVFESLFFRFAKGQDPTLWVIFFLPVSTFRFPRLKGKDNSIALFLFSTPFRTNLLSTSVRRGRMCWWKVCNGTLASEKPIATPKRSSIHQSLKVWKEQD